jgi:hypothetical protein
MLSFDAIRSAAFLALGAQLFQLIDLRFIL